MPMFTSTGRQEALKASVKQIEVVFAIFERERERESDR
jgi:hypothetical protein